MWELVQQEEPLVFIVAVMLSAERQAPVRVTTSHCVRTIWDMLHITNSLFVHMGVVWEVLISEEQDNVIC